MSEPRIGVDVDDFRLRPREALRRAADLDFHVVELATVAGDLAPWNLSSSGQRHLLRYVDGLGLHMAALVADLPGLRLTDPRTVDERVERTCRILQLATDLKVPVVTASAGMLTHPDTGEPSEAAIEALKRIGEYADLRGITYSLRPSGDSGERIVRVLDELSCPSIGICLDPAATVMNGVNPLTVIERSPDQIRLMHARDATAGLSERAGHETRFGEGEVDLIGVLAALEAADYAGPYILRRTDSQTPLADIQDARDVLTRLLPPA